MSWAVRSFQKCNINNVMYQRIRLYAAPAKKADAGSKKKIGKFGTVVEKKQLPVETDTNRLVNYVCGTNLLKEGGDDVKIKSNSEYPDWLWGLRTGPAPTLDELDPETLEYWKKVRKLGRKRDNQLRTLRKF